MKRVVILFLLTFLTPFIGFTQTSISFDYVSPFYEGFSAVKKGNQWAFINTEGVIVIDFRNDLVSTKINNEEYPYSFWHSVVHLVRPILCVQGGRGR